MRRGIKMRILWAVLWRLVIVASILIGGSYLALLIIMNIVLNAPEVSLPSLVGMTEDEAEANVSKLGIKLIVERRFDDNFPKGQILFQDPPANILVKVGRTVKVIVSKGSEEVTVPNVVGMSQRLGEIALREAGLQVGRRVTKHSQQVPEDCIISQEPRPNTVVKRDSQVDLLISLGKPPVIFAMPDIVGMPLDEARAKIEEVGLKLGSISKRRVTDGTDENVVLFSNPEGGEGVEAGTVVSLVVSEKPPPQDALRQAIINYTVPIGLFDQQVSIVVEDLQGEREIFNEIRSPGSRITQVVFVTDNARYRVYINGDLKEERFLN
ncbi:MAG: PASTA domain-containing protein [bacterium]